MLVLDANVVLPASRPEDGFRLLGDAELGWAKTHDAEYLALARHLRCRLVTLDDRLRRGTRRLGLAVVSPGELG